MLYSSECYKIIGACMEVHKHLGKGFLEIVYKDALELEFRAKNILFEREKKFHVNYKGNILEHSFQADFVVFDKIILEVKSVKENCDFFTAQALNYLKVSNNRLALIVNFGKESLEYKRIVL